MQQCCGFCCEVSILYVNHLKLKGSNHFKRILFDNTKRLSSCASLWSQSIWRNFPLWLGWRLQLNEPHFWNWGPSLNVKMIVVHAITKLAETSRRGVLDHNYWKLQWETKILSNWHIVHVSSFTEQLLLLSHHFRSKLARKSFSCKRNMVRLKLCTWGSLLWKASAYPLAVPKPGTERKNQMLLQVI